MQRKKTFELAAEGIVLGQKLDQDLDEVWSPDGSSDEGVTLGELEEAGLVQAASQDDSSAFEASYETLKTAGWPPEQLDETRA